MNTRFRIRRDRLGPELRAAAPRPGDEFVNSLARDLAIARPARRRTRLAFASGFTVIMVGALASFGGVGYASSGAAVVKSVVVTKKTSAQGQYDQERAVQPAPVVKGVAVTKTTKAKPKPTVASSGTLPFTGLSLIGTIALGGALVGVGIAIRRRESRD